MRRNGGLSFGRRRRKFNAAILKEVIAWAGELALALLIAYVIVSFFGVRTSVVGSAMNSTLSANDQILINKFIYLVTSPKRGDVIVFLPNGNEKSHYYVRRVVGVPGDTVQIVDGVVYINGEQYDDIAAASIEEPGVAEEPVKLGTDEYFVLGDNRNNSEDSRYANIGSIKKEYIVGKAWFRFSSISDMGWVK